MSLANLIKSHTPKTVAVRQLQASVEAFTRNAKLVFSKEELEEANALSQAQVDAVAQDTQEVPVVTISGAQAVEEAPAEVAQAEADGAADASGVPATGDDTGTPAVADPTDEGAPAPADAEAPVEGAEAPAADADADAAAPEAEDGPVEQAAQESMILTRWVKTLESLRDDVEAGLGEVTDAERTRIDLVGQAATAAMADSDTEGSILPSADELQGLSRDDVVSVLDDRLEVAQEGIIDTMRSGFAKLMGAFGSYTATASQMKRLAPQVASGQKPVNAYKLLEWTRTADVKSALTALTDFNKTTKIFVDGYGEVISAGDRVNSKESAEEFFKLYIATLEKIPAAKYGNNFVFVPVLGTVAILTDSKGAFAKMDLKPAPGEKQLKETIGELALSPEELKELANQMAIFADIVPEAAKQYKKAEDWTLSAARASSIHSLANLVWGYGVSLEDHFKRNMKPFTRLFM